MIASIDILSYWRMARLAPDLPAACAVVSILNPSRRDARCCGAEGAFDDSPPGSGDLEANPIFAAEDPRVLTLRFWDVEEGDSPDPAFYREWPPIDAAQADSIAAFLLAAHRDPMPLPFYAHCAAGISRSAAVGEVAGMLAGISFSTLQAASRTLLMPNATVKALVLRALRRRRDAIL